MGEYGKKVRIALINQGRTQKWLIEQVSAMTGLYFDSAYLSRVLHGKNKNPKVVSAIDKILGL